MHPSFNRPVTTKKTLTLSSAKTISELEDLKKQKDFNINQPFPGKKNALFTAGYEKSKWLIENGISIKKLDSKSRNALHYVKTPEKFELLISHNINVNCLSMFNRSFLYAMSKKMLDYIFSEKCTVDLSQVVNQIDNKGNNFLHFFLNNINMSDEYTQEECIPFIDSFAKKGGNPTFKTKTKISALDIVCYNPDIFIYLLDHFNFEKIDEPYLSITTSSVTEEKNLLCHLLHFSINDENKCFHIDKNLNYLYEKKHNEFVNMANYIKSKPELERFIPELNKFLITREKEFITKSLNINKNTEKHTKRL